MSIVFASLPTFAFLLLCLAPIDAYASDWLVSRTTSQVTYAADRKAWLPVKEGMAVPNRAWVSTGPRGRVMLIRGAESISVGPDTLVAIWTKGGLLSVKTDIIQQKGEIALDIEKRRRPHTYVHTPFLAAVVKGTSFTVTVTGKNASVAVDRGLVQVSSFTGGESTNIGPGQQATVDDAQTMSVNGIGTVPSVVSVEPTRALVPAFGRRAPIGTGLGLPSFNGRGPAAGSTGRSNPAASNSVPGESSESGEHGTSWNNSAGAARDAHDDGGGSSGGGSGNGSGGTVSDGSSSGGSGGSGSGSSSGSGSGGSSGGGSGGDDDDDDDDDDDGDDDDDD